MTSRIQNFCLAAIAIVTVLLAFFAVVETQTTATERGVVLRYETCNQCKIEQKKELSFVQALFTDPVAFFTALLFFATAWLAFLTYRLVRDAKEEAAAQSKATHRSLAEAARSAKAAEDALSHARYSTERELRAYLFVRQIEIETRAPGIACGSIVIANAGRTPAANVRTQWRSIQHCQPPYDQTIIPKEILSIQHNTEAPTTCGPDSAFAITFTFSTDTPLGNIPIGTKNARTVFAQGHVEYRDVFGNERATDFCVRMTMTEVVRALSRGTLVMIQPSAAATADRVITSSLVRRGRWRRKGLRRLWQLLHNSTGVFIIRVLDGRRNLTTLRQAAP